MAQAHVHTETCEHEHAHPVRGPREWLGPLIVGAIGLGACILLNFRDPNESGSWGLCPFKAATGGLDCPGCGLLRGTRALTRGDITGALDHNILIIPILGTILVAYAIWAAKSFGWTDMKVRINPIWGWIAGAVIIGFWIVRNLPQFPYLDSGLL